MSKVLLITNWRRPDMYRKVLDALYNCDGIEEYTILNHVDIFSNGNLIPMFRALDTHHKLSKVCKIITDPAPRPMGNAMQMHRAWRNAFALYENPTPEDFPIFLEDDDIPGKDWLRYMEWANKEFVHNPEIFCVVGWNRRTEKLPQEDFDISMNLVGTRKPFKSYLAWGMWRYIWDEMKDGWFGIKWNEPVFKPDDNLEGADIKEGKDFLNQIVHADDGSWGWPLLKYWAKGRKEVYPYISRCQNIGSIEGRFNWDTKWHAQYIETKVWSQDAVPTEYIRVDNE